MAYVGGQLFVCVFVICMCACVHMCVCGGWVGLLGVGEGEG